MADEEILVDPATYVDPGNILIEGLMRIGPASSVLVKAGYDAITQAAELDRLDRIDQGLREDEPLKHQRLQQFEEGDVAMIAFPRVRADGTVDGNLSAYLMAFFNVEDTGVCARPHVHPYGERAVIIFNSGDSIVTVRSLSDIDANDAAIALSGQTEDTRQNRKEFTIPQGCAAIVRIPPGVSHQFVPQGGRALALSIHPAEVDELKKIEGAPNMASQTAWLLPAMQTLTECLTSPQSPIVPIETQKREPEFYPTWGSVILASDKPNRLGLYSLAYTIAGKTHPTEPSPVRE